MNKEYVTIRSLAALEKEQAVLRRRIKLSEKLLQKDYDQFKASFSITNLVLGAVKGISRLAIMTRAMKTGFSLLSLLIGRKK